MDNQAVIAVENLAIGYGDEIVLKDLNFQINRGEIFGFLGGSGCGKSTLLRTLVGLQLPKGGKAEVFQHDMSLIKHDQRRQLMQRMGVTFQGGALLGSLTLLENVALPLEEFSNLKKSEIVNIALEKLELVGLKDYANYLPDEISGGMMKRAGLARALVRNPELLFFDEPSAGLDPINSAELDKLILSLREQFNTTIVIVTHELESIFSIIDRAIILDSKTKTIVDTGDPRVLRTESEHAWVKEFLLRRGMTLENYSKVNYESK